MFGFTATAAKTVNHTVSDEPPTQVVLAAHAENNCEGPYASDLDIVYDTTSQQSYNFPYIPLYENHVDNFMRSVI